MPLFEHKDDSANHHPIFDKENAQEISLLDGIDANHIVEAQSQIEQPEAQKSSRNLSYFRGGQ